MDKRPGDAGESQKKLCLLKKNIASHIIQKVLLKTQNYQNWPHQFFCFKKIIACLIIQKVLFKTQNYQNWPHQFFCIKNSQTVMLPVLAFFGQQLDFLINKTSV